MILQLLVGGEQAEVNQYIEDRIQGLPKTIPHFYILPVRETKYWTRW